MPKWRIPADVRVEAHAGPRPDSDGSTTTEPLTVAFSAGVLDTEDPVEVRLLTEILVPGGLAEAIPAESSQDEESAEEATAAGPDSTGSEDDAAPTRSRRARRTEAEEG